MLRKAIGENARLCVFLSFLLLSILKNSEYFLPSSRVPVWAGRLPAIILEKLLV
jgi:hypothetical protein